MRRPLLHSTPPSFSLIERILLIIAVFLMIVGLAGYLYDRRLYKYTVPNEGGIYIEGVLNDNPTKVERIITRLTNIGLTYRESDGSLQPALSESWTVSEDKKTYDFYLRSGYNSASLLGIIQGQKNSWQSIQIEAPEPDILRFQLNDPSVLFLSTTTQLLFPYGPYELAKRETNETILRPNREFPLQTPYIQKIVIKSYENQEQLVKAAKSGEISASADFTETPSRVFIEQELQLPKFQILIFNTAKPSLKNVEDRRRIIQSLSGPAVSYTLLTSQSGFASELADQLASSLASKGITITVQKKSGSTLQKEDIAKREFDLLLYGINYGAVRDYYPFWHSSQSGTNGYNISGVKDKTLDGLLESAHNESDEMKRDTLNKQIESFLTDNAFQKTLNQESYHFWVNKSVKGVKYAKIEEGNDRFNLFWQWYVETKKTKEPQ